MGRQGLSSHPQSKAEAILSEKAQTATVWTLIVGWKYASALNQLIKCDEFQDANGNVKQESYWDYSLWPWCSTWHRGKIWWAWASSCPEYGWRSSRGRTRATCTKYRPCPTRAGVRYVRRSPSRGWWYWRLCSRWSRPSPCCTNERCKTRSLLTDHTAQLLAFSYKSTPEWPWQLRRV